MTSEKGKDDELLRLFDVPFKFTSRPAPVPTELRPLWRIALVLLVLRFCCRGRKSTLNKLQVVTWAARNPLARPYLERFVLGETLPSDVSIRFDPFLNRAIEYAVAERLLTRPDGEHVQLAPLGEKMVDEIEDSKSLEEEIVFLKSLKNSITEKLIARLFKFGGQ